MLLAQFIRSQLSDDSIISIAKACLSSNSNVIQIMLKSELYQKFASTRKKANLDLG